MKHISILFVFFISSQIAFTQAIGYQGKKFIIQAGYIPANNVPGIIFDSNLEDDYFSNDPDNPDEKDPILFLHLPKVEIEYALVRYGSVFVRYNPFRQVSNIAYTDQGTGQFVDYAGVETKGNMVSLGYRFYTSGNIAPLGSYIGLYGTFFPFTATFTDSKYGDAPAPGSITDYPATSDNLIGAFIQYGVKNIFWNHVVLDVQIDAGYFFKDTKPYLIADYTEEEFAPYALASQHDPVYYAAKNTRIFFLIAPSVNLGLLVF